MEFGIGTKEYGCLLIKIIKIC